MQNPNALSEQRLQKTRFRLFSLGLAAALCFTASSAFAACDNTTPISNETATCDTNPPNPYTASGVGAVAGSTNVTININAGAGIYLSGATVRVNNNSTATNNGTLDTRTSANGYGMWAGDSSNSTSTTAGYGNILTNNGAIITGGTGARGLYARTRHATLGNTLTNTGTITTAGNAAAGIRAESRGGSIINNSGTVTASGTGANGIEMVGPGTITNTGTVKSNQSIGVFGSDLVYPSGASGTTYSGVTLDNSGSISGQTIAIQLGSGADTVILRAGSALTGSIDGGGTASVPAGSLDQLIFNGFVDPSFGNTITNFNLLQATGSADVGLTAANYSFDQVQIDAGSSLAFIDTDLSTPSDIIDNGVLIFSNSTDSGFTGVIAGSGNLVKEGTAIFTLSGTNTYSGTTTVSSGVLQAGAANTFSPNSDVTVALGAALDLNDFDQAIPSLTNNGSVSMGNNTAGTQLVVNDYVGGNGAISMSVDASPASDLLVITGTVSGSTVLQIANIGGTPVTGDGILVVDASSATVAPGTSFTLLTALVIGGNEYRLFKGGASGNNPQNWYLRHPTPTAGSSTQSIPTLNPAVLVLLAFALAIAAAFYRGRGRGGSLS